MSDRRILKWEVLVDDREHFVGSGWVVHVGIQPRHPDLSWGPPVVAVWTLEDVERGLPEGAVPMRAFGTGQPLPEHAVPVGSVIDGGFVWHICDMTMTDEPAAPPHADAETVTSGETARDGGGAL